MITALLLLAVLLLGLLLRSEYERKHFVTEQFVITSEKLGEERRKLVFLSDLHNQQFGRENEQLVRKVRELCPDAVLIGGDMMVCKGQADLSVTLGLVKQLRTLCPVYYALGNHEARMREEKAVYGDLYRRLEEGLSEAGATLLADQSAFLGERIRVTGCGLLESYYRHRFTIPVLPAEAIKDRVGLADAERFQILLFHSPLFFAQCRSWGADLTLSGHFHGGTIRLPLLGGVMTPQYQFFLPWCAGQFEREGKTMIVSRGLGTHSINIRLNNRPQLVVVILKGLEKGEQDGAFL